ncbi:DUF397 domain-containing protein [Nocardiopsis rhodophaea]
MNSMWHKSTYSSGGTNCVEAREHEQGADLRDSQHPGLGVLSFGSGEQAAFLAALRKEEL